MAAVPAWGGYVSLVKIGVVVVLLFGWAAACQWVDRDTDAVKTKREQWNVIVLSGSLVGFLVLLAPPWRGVLFLVGVALWLLIAGGALLAYVIHRNGRVVVGARVLTGDHVKRLLAGSGGKKKRVSDKGTRVRITGHDGKPVELPDDPEERVDYQLTQDFLFDLLWRRASDADIVAGRERYRLIQRIDGVATEQSEGIATEDGERMFRYLKRIAGLNVAERRRPQTGKLQAALLGHTGDMGVTTVHTSGSTAGERLRLHFQPEVLQLRTHELGIAEPRLKQLDAIIKEATGLLIVSAPAQHGRSTTQYALLRAHDAFIQNIHTIERRILVELDNVTQHKFEGSNSDVDYARRLQTVLRREPDVVMVGECEDRETAQIAARAAADDRRIYLGLGARDSFEALSRFLKLVDDNPLAAKALRAVMSQRLVRKLCMSCREAFRPDAATLKKLNLPVDKIDRFHRPPTEPILDKKGNEIICQQCQGTGYFGRTGVFEVLIVDSGVRKLIAEGAPINRIKAQCRKNKMYYLQEEGLLKVIGGTTSIHEILRGLRTDTK